MAGTTISGSYTTGIALTSAGSNPAAYVTGTIDVGSGVAFGASAASAWSVTNQGSIRSGNGPAVSIVSGVYLTNNAGGAISGSSGIYIGNATGTVTNLGDIAGLGASGYGVRLSRGGTVTNASGGTISGYKAVPLRDGTVVNAGVIQGVGVGAYGVGIFNGSVTNQSGGVISGGSSGTGIQLNFATMQNEGTIGGGIGALLQTYGGFANDGVITGGTHAISLNGGGQITNQSNATIEGGASGYAIAFTNGFGLVQNFGSIGGPAGAISFAPNYSNLLIIDPGATFGGKVNGGNPIGSTAKSSILLGSGTGAGTFSGFGSTFVNFASIGVTIGSTWTIDTTLGSAYPVNNIGTLINAGSIGAGVNLSGVLTNASGATITSSGSAVHGYGTVVNAGEIAGKDGVYLFLSVDNDFTNLAGGVVTGSRDGVYMRGTVDMLNAGSIAGVKHAVQFGSGYFDTLTVDPGASFSGLVDGGNSIGATYVTTLVLASGASAGTIANLGSQYINFGRISVDTGAAWRLAGQATLVAGTTLINDGTLSILANAAFADAGVVENDGAIVLDPSTMELANLNGTGSATIGAASTLDALGNVASGQTIVFTGTGGYLHLSAPASMTGTVTQFAVGQTIDLQGVDPASVTFSSGELNFAGGGFALGLASGGAVQVAASGDGAVVTVVAQQVNGTTISGSYVAGITLTNPPGNPVYVTGTIDAASGVALSGSSGTVWTITNEGSIFSGDSSGISLASGGTVSNEQDGTIGGYSGVYVGAATGSVTNVGAISGTGERGFGVQLARGGSVSNQSGGTISGYMAVLIRSNAGGTVTNAGSIGGLGADSYGVGLSAGSVTNQSGGAITGGSSGDGVKLGGGTMFNFGTVSGGVGISAASYSTLTNDGDITGDTEALMLAGGGVVINSSGGTIAGGASSYAIHLTGVGDVTNGGSIGGGAGAIAFAPNYFNLLVVDPGATFGGKVNGGNTIGAESNSSLDLASGASAGTLSGFGSTFVNFAIISVASDASWTIDATIGTGYAVVDSGELTNTGSIGSGVVVGGVLTNASAATITSAGSAVNGSGTVVNAGNISGEDGVYLSLNATNSVTNIAGGVITGNRDGVYLRGTAELRNAGSITGGANAVRFLAGYSDTLTVDPGAVFSGTVDGGNPIGAADVTTLVLASGASAGMIAGLGSRYVDFGQVTIGSGAAWDIAGQNTLAAGTTLTNSGSLTVSANAIFADAGTIVNDGGIVLDPSALQVADLVGNGSVTIGADSTLDAQGGVASAQTIVFTGAGGYLHLDAPADMAGRVTQFAIGQTIDLKGVDPASVTLSSGQLRFTGGSFSLALTGAAGKVDAVASADGAVVTAAACFRAGTRIATEHGDVPVERLAVGDQVLTLIGGRGHAPVVWIGLRRIDCARHNRPQAVWPVRVAAGAFGLGRPRRALWLSPDHAVFLDDVLIPIRYLINGSTIAQVRVTEVSYFHIELPRHDVLLAEGLPTESYLDTGDRSQFSNGGNVVALHPEFVARAWEAAGCAPLVVTGPKLAAIKQRMGGIEPPGRQMHALARWAIIGTTG